MATTLRLVNGSAGDPALYLDFPGAGNALLFDAGENESLSRAELGDLAAILLSHHHPDHLCGLARVVRYTCDTARTISVFGPPNTITRVEHVLRGMEHLRFPFMRVVFEVTELSLDGAGWPRARFACEQGFAREDLAPARRTRSGVLVRLPEVRVRYALASHTMPCLAYAADIARGLRYDADKACGAPLRPGPWVREVLEAMSLPRARRPARIQVAGGSYPLLQLVADYFSVEPARTVAFVTDTRREPDTYAGLVALCSGADQLYCDAYYLDSESRQAQRHGHLTAREAGELARDAGVAHLTLIHMGPRYRGRFEELVAEARRAFPDTDAELIPERESTRDAEP